MRVSSRPILARRWRGFYEPIHWLACLRSHEVARPAMACFGYRTALHDDAAHLTNATMPLNLLDNVQGYSIDILPGKRRTDLRKCRRLVQTVRLTGCRLLASQGFDVRASAAKRTGVHGTDRDRYLASVDKFVHDRRRIVLAGLVHGNLGGYLTGYAVEDVAYIESVMIASEYLPTAIGTGLVFDFVTVCQKNSAIRRIVYGQHSIEDIALNTFKSGMLFPKVDVPCHLWLSPGLGAYMRWRRPYVYYRLAGRQPKSAVLSKQHGQPSANE